MESSKGKYKNSNKKKIIDWLKTKELLQQLEIITNSNISNNKDLLLNLDYLITFRPNSKLTLTYFKCRFCLINLSAYLISMRKCSILWIQKLILKLIEFAKPIRNLWRLQTNIFFVKHSERLWGGLVLKVLYQLFRN